MDPGAAIAKRIKYLLDSKSVRSQGEKHNQMFCTEHFPEESQFKKALNLWGFESLDVIKID